MASFPKDTRAIGTKLTKKKSGTETTDWEVGSLTSIGEVKITIGEEDITTLDSPNRAKEYMPGDIEAGEVSIAGITKKANDEITITKMAALIAGSAVEHWTIEFPSGAKWEFDAFVKEFGTDEASVDGMVSFSGSLRISGLPVYTPATA